MEKPDNHPIDSTIAEIAANGKNSPKKAVTKVTKRDGSVVEEILVADGSYQKTTKLGKTKDMSHSGYSTPPRATPKGQTGANFLRSDVIPPGSSTDPNIAWRAIQESQAFQDVPTVSSRDSLWNTPNSDCTRIVCMSDTHGQHGDISVPRGDILIHAGDFTKTGELGNVKGTAMYLQELEFPTAVCIAGNHDLTLDVAYYERSWRRFHRKKLDAEKGRETILQLMKDTTTDNTTIKKPRFVYLEDSSCNIPIKTREGVLERQPQLSIYGSPWSPEFYDWAFNVPRGQPSWDIWSKIPNDTDVLVTHGPPLGRGDLCEHGGRAGCHDLLEHVQRRIQPRLHIFGHIHEGFGVTYDGKTLYINASNLDLEYDSVHPCTVVDLPHDPTLPARIVQPHCTLTGEDLVSDWFRDHGYHALAGVVAASGCEGQDFPSGNDLLQTANANRDICRQLKFHTVLSMQAKKELRRALSQIYAESF